MFRSNKILVKADLSNTLSEVLSLLDPRESCLITYMPTYDRPGGDDIGVYVVEFENEQLFGLFSHEHLGWHRGCQRNGWHPRCPREQHITDTNQ